MSYNYADYHHRQFDHPWHPAYTPSRALPTADRYPTPLPYQPDRYLRPPPHQPDRYTPQRTARTSLRLTASSSRTQLPVGTRRKCSSCNRRTNHRRNTRPTPVDPSASNAAHTRTTHPDSAFSTEFRLTISSLQPAGHRHHRPCAVLPAGTRLPSGRHRDSRLPTSLRRMNSRRLAAGIRPTSTSTNNRPSTPHVGPHHRRDSPLVGNHR